MPIELPPLPYLPSSLQPQLSPAAMEAIARQRAGLLQDITRQIGDGPLQELDLGGLLKQAQGRLFEQAAQLWNLTFWLEGLRPRGPGPGPALAPLISRHFGDATRMVEDARRMGLALFGSGWIWLVQHPDGRLGLQATRNAGTVATGPATPLLAINVWEHAYYLDYQNDRARWLDSAWQLVDWERVEQRLQG